MTQMGTDEDGICPQMTPMDADGDGDAGWSIAGVVAEVFDGDQATRLRDTA
jgi:hypothetical protein